MQAHSRLKIFAYLLVPPLTWGGNAIAGKLSVGLIGPFSLSFFRWTIASLIILPFAWRVLKNQREIITAHWWRLVLVSILGAGLFNTLIYLGLNYTSANNSSIILASMPLGIIALSATLGMERTNALQISGLLISVLGVLWIITNGSLQNLLQFKFNQGDIAILGCVIVWAVYSVLLKKWRPPALQALPFLAIQVMCGMAFALPLFAFEQSQGAPILWQPLLYLILLYVGIFPSLLAFFFWQQGIAMGGANVAGLFIPLISVFTAIFGYFILGETLNSIQASGALAIICGVLLAFWHSFRE